jgi:hypothetical protein
MENNKKRPDDQENNQDSHSEGSTGAANAARLDAVIGNTGATSAARSHKHTDTWSNQGTNISYEGATAPGSGGSVGTGQASGQDATGARVSTSANDDYASHSKKDKDNRGENQLKPDEHNDNLDRDTLGTP